MIETMPQYLTEQYILLLSRALSKLTIFGGPGSAHVFEMQDFFKRRVQYEERSISAW